MRLKFSSIELMLVLLACIGVIHAHQQPATSYKWENGFMLAWSLNSSDTSAPQISIFDERDQIVAQFNILRLVPEAQRVSIWDVSINGDLIAVGGVYRSKEGTKKVRPTATLLILNKGGELLFADALAPGHGISRLVVDDQSNIWTLTDGAGTEVSPSKVPMVVEYNREGNVVREVLTHNMFPVHALDTKEDIVMGHPEMGYHSGTVWFWLPGSTELVTISTVDGKAQITKTELPKRPGRREVVLAIARESSGDVVGEFREDDDQLRTEIPPDMARYVWSPSTGSWSQLKPSGCEPGWLIGVSEKGPVYMQIKTERACMASAP